MANSSIFLVVLIFLLSSFVITTTATAGDFVIEEEMDKKEVMNFKKEKLSHLRFYWQDMISGKNPSGVDIIPPTASKTSFGSIRMIDNPLTIAVEMGSRIVGRAQGFYASTSQEEIAASMMMNFVFLEGKYNGSTLIIMGRNSVFNPVRELTIVGGSGLFRWARGYALARTRMYNATRSRDATVQYDVYVLHY